MRRLLSCRGHSPSSMPGMADLLSPPERLLRALLLQAFYTVRSELQLMEQLNYNLLFRRCDLLGRDPPPLTFRPSSYDLELELLMQPDSPIIISQRIGKKGKGQLSRSTAALPPAKPGWGMVEQVEPQRQRLRFVAVADGDDGLPRTRLAVRRADIGFAGHHF